MSATIAKAATEPITRLTIDTAVRNIFLTIRRDGASCSALLFHRKSDQSTSFLTYAHSYSANQCRVEKTKDGWGLWIDGTSFEIKAKDCRAIADLLGCELKQGGKS
ncbi:hypothetical protein C798_18380 [Herbaspirillum rubrisubalbicans Os34]|uniref:Uncharacterized protein n=1 Tax=Herbaspirillum rubrisubalbicans Os34 TaxID=1235827 RepID=A0A6M3ZU79_9BURK|nr:hypothetical protein [Herbaspirillum rubrisubalbicans]QJQ02127.1 hypothetical protein C798_18380 [Herbaspirillum rubrisubalbicans Os34]